MNPVSKRTHSQNVLREKTKTFKDNIKETQNRMRSVSSTNNLAGKLYSQKTNLFFTPRKSVKETSIPRNSSADKISPIGTPGKSLINPEMLMSATVNSVMNGLSTRASHVPSFAEMNTALLKEKKQLQQRIAALKEGIKQERNKLSRTNENCKKNQNEIDKTRNLYEQANRKSKNLNDNINSTNFDCANFRRDIQDLREQIKERKEDKAREMRNIEQLENECKNLKVNLLQEEKARTYTKGELSKSQRVMNSASIYYKELEDEKAILLLEINKSVDTFKL